MNGELKKRFKENAQSFYEITPTIDETIFNEIVEEARNSFPVSKEEIKFDLAWKQKHRKTDLQIHIRKMYKWFIKWFGEGDENNDSTTEAED